MAVVPSLISLGLSQGLTKAEATKANGSGALSNWPWSVPGIDKSRGH
jgi:hypothetical protein